MHTSSSSHSCAGCLPAKGGEGGVTDERVSGVVAAVRAQEWGWRNCERQCAVDDVGVEGRGGGSQLGIRSVLFIKVCLPHAPPCVHRLHSLLLPHLLQSPFTLPRIFLREGWRKREGVNLGCVACTGNVVFAHSIVALGAVVVAARKGLHCVRVVSNTMWFPLARAGLCRSVSFFLRVVAVLELLRMLEADPPLWRCPPPLYWRHEPMRLRELPQCMGYLRGGGVEGSGRGGGGW